MKQSQKRYISDKSIYARHPYFFTNNPYDSDCEMHGNQSIRISSPLGSAIHASIKLRAGLHSRLVNGRQTLVGTSVARSKRRRECVSKPTPSRACFIHHLWTMAIYQPKFLPILDLINPPESFRGASRHLSTQQPSRPFS